MMFTMCHREGSLLVTKSWNPISFLKKGHFEDILSDYGYFEFVFLQKFISKVIQVFFEYFFLEIAFSFEFSLLAMIVDPFCIHEITKRKSKMVFGFINEVLLTFEFVKNFKIFSLGLAFSDLILDFMNDFPVNSVQNRSVLSSVSILCTDTHQGFFQSEKYLQKDGNNRNIVNYFLTWLDLSLKTFNCALFETRKVVEKVALSILNWAQQFWIV